MKLNNKGTSLIELIVSVALISVVLIFMFKLLLDVNNEITNNTFAKDNQVVRAEVIRMIENDLNANILTGISHSGNASRRIITFYFGTKTSTLTLTPTTIQYTPSTGTSDRRLWELDDCTLYTQGINMYWHKDANIFSMIMDIEIHTSNDLNTAGHNNYLDDIAISYMGNTNDIAAGYTNIFTLTCIGDCTY